MAVLAGMMLVGCEQKQTEEPAEAPAEATAEPTAEATAEPTAETTETAENAGALLGGWTVNTEYNSMMADNDVARFEKALEGLVGVGYTPVTILATQVVNGTNHAYLAKGTTVTAEPVDGWYVVVVNENSAGEISLVNIKQIDVADIHTKDNADGAALGGWTATDTGKAGMLAGEDTMIAFEAAAEKLLGVTLNPITVLGTQVVNGTNYAVISRGKTVTENPELSLYITKFHAGTDGTVDEVENAVFDLEYYVTPEEAPEAGEASPVVGDWELTRVTATVPGGEPAEMNPEENASLFGDKGYYTFNEDGTGSLNIYEGDTVATTDGTWTNDGDTYTFTGASGADLVVTYDKSADTLTREYTDDSADAQYSKIVFVYTRKK